MTHAGDTYGHKEGAQGPDHPCHKIPQSANVVSDMTYLSIVRIKHVKHQQDGETEDDAKCVLVSALLLLIGFSVRLKSTTKNAEYKRKRKRQQVANETEAERCMQSSAVPLCMHHLIVRAAQG